VDCETTLRHQHNTRQDEPKHNDTSKSNEYKTAASPAHALAHPCCVSTQECGLYFEFVCFVAELNHVLAAFHHVIQLVAHQFVQLACLLLQTDQLVIVLDLISFRPPSKIIFITISVMAVIIIIIIIIIIIGMTITVNTIRRCTVMARSIIVVPCVLLR